jgi:peroxiredoxin family protein
MPLLKKAGKDEDISSLVRKGLEVEIHQTMEALQVLRKSPVQLTQFNSQEDRETALRFFDSLKEILERRMLKNPNEN